MSTPMIYKMPLFTIEIQMKMKLKTLGEIMREIYEQDVQIDFQGKNEFKGEAIK